MPIVQNKSRGLPLSDASEADGFDSADDDSLISFERGVTVSIISFLSASRCTLILLSFEANSASPITLLIYFAKSLRLTQTVISAPNRCSSR